MNFIYKISSGRFYLACLFFGLAIGNAKGANLTINAIDRGGHPIADAIVYATPTSGQLLPASNKSGLIDQIKKEFVPFVSVIQVGTAVRFPNKDNIRHHVYSFSPAKTFSLKLYAGTPAEPVIFDQPGEVVLGCNIHDHMLAYVYVVDTPYFAKTDTNGIAYLKNLVDGDYNIQLWHPYQNVASKNQTVKLKTEDTRSIKFEVELEPRAPQKKE